MIRILSDGEVVEAVQERALSNGLFEVDLITKLGKYRAIMSEIRVPAPQVCTYLIEHLPKVGDLEEYEILEMAHAIMREDKKAFTVNAIAEAIPYLCRIGLIVYQKKPTLQHGDRFFFRRTGTTTQIQNLLSSPPPPPPLPSQGGEGDSSDKPDPEPEPEPNRTESEDKPRKKKKKKKTKKEPPAKQVPESPRPKKQKCCNNPHPVKSKKTGKRRCKNCGAKLGKKKKKAKPQA